VSELASEPSNTVPGYPAWIVRRAPWFLLALHVPIMIMPLLLITTGGVLPHSRTEKIVAAIAIVASGALHLRHVFAAAAGRRPAGWPWTLAAQAALFFVMDPWLGADWSSNVLPLTASAMLMLPGRVGTVVGFVVPLAADSVLYYHQIIAGLHGAARFAEVVYYPVIMSLFALALYGTVRLVRLVNELDATRTEATQLAVDRERVRVSRDLHDLLGHSLSAISLKGDLAIRLLPIDSDGARAEITGITEVARAALRDVRAVTRDEHRVTLREEIAAAAVLLTAAGIAPTIDAVSSTAAVPAVVEQVLAWAVREGTTNLLRHSAASTATITLARQGGTIELEMINDGVPDGAHGDGTGLAGLRERAAALGGAATAAAEPAGRFRLHVTVPATGEDA